MTSSLRKCRPVEFVSTVLLAFGLGNVSRRFYVHGVGSLEVYIEFTMQSVMVDANGASTNTTIYPSDAYADIGKEHEKFNDSHLVLLPARASLSSLRLVDSH